MNADIADIIDLFIDDKEDEAKRFIKKVVKDNGGFTKLAKNLGMPTSNIHRMLSKKGNPTTRHLFLILRNL
jgi:DNA-binding phage protein